MLIEKPGLSSCNLSDDMSNLSDDMSNRFNLSDDMSKVSDGEKYEASKTGNESMETYNCELFTSELLHNYEVGRNTNLVLLLRKFDNNNVLQIVR